MSPGAEPGRETSFNLVGVFMMHKWFVKDGSIFSTEVKVKNNKDFRLGLNFKTNPCIAFNVGDKLAKYIVDLHNSKIDASSQ